VDESARSIIREREQREEAVAAAVQRAASDARRQDESLAAADMHLRVR
jgi:hypothetical protein